ncbi:right-handed parallel beta-helix repeat-containing protein [Microbulbifer sp. A4B17]|uniref:right-handed parallel beta-helix repeat-containing protein n=1 Tax=Microbulbifer sp. A4B17 TaxID=359370 RepID=UPI001863CAF3|nr:right-handed parallel beta-helix repeat-containing protein [Microbulbifer sp. A4B17]
MRSSAYNYPRLLAFQKNVQQLVQYLFLSLVCVSAFTYAEVTVDEDISPWQLSIVGASTGDVVLSGDDQALSLGISEICVAENQVSEDFSSGSSEDLSLFGFQSFGGEALLLLNERVTVTAQAHQVLLAPTVLSDSSEITLSAFINSSTDVGAGTDSLSIYLTDGEYAGYGVQYQGDGSTGVWAIVQFAGADSQSNLAQVAATDNHPTTGQTVTLNRSGDTLTVTVGGSDIGLTYTVGEGIDDLSRYGIRSTSLEVSDNNYLDDLELTFSSNATCPALADTGEWDDAYSLHFVYQELLQQGELIARLSSHSNSGSGIAGIALRNGTAATDKAIALVMDPADNSIGLFTRDTDDAANTLTSTGQTGALPQWLRLVRDGDTITAYISTDGTSWTQVDSVSISFDDIVKAGIAVAVTGSEAQTLEYDNLSVINELSGDITSDMELAAHQTYVVTGNVVVNSGVTLTINEGATILFDGDFTLEVNGNLVASGGEDTSVVFTSAQVSPAKGDWYGIVVNSGGSVNLSNAIIEYADYGVNAKPGSTFSLNNSTLQYFDEHGVYAYGASGSISNSIIQYADTAGVYLYGVADVAVSDNAITDNAYGFYIRGASGGVTTPTITGNTITDNSSYGFYLYGSGNVSYDPLPVINGNSIYNNSADNVYTSNYGAGSTTNIDATGNWWNATDPGSISPTIYDYTDTGSDSNPFIDYSGFLDTEDGAAVVSHSLVGTLTEDTTLLSGNTYTMLGHLYVGTGTVLTVEPGARIESGGSYRIVVDGTLKAIGTSESPIVFTSDEESASSGQWKGIRVDEGGSVELDYVTLEYGEYGLYAQSGSSFSLSNSIVQYIEEDGVYAYNASGSVSNSTIQYAENAGVYLYGVAEVSVSDNTITDNEYGFYIKSHSSGVTTPIITGNTVIDNSSYGFYLNGSGNANYDPLPVINGNSIYNNTSDNVYTSNYGSGSTTFIDVTGNWWNATDPGSISPTIYDYSDTGSDSNPFIDYSGFLDSEDGAAVISHALMGTLTEDTTLSSGITYTMLGGVYVDEGTVLTVEPGARIESGGAYRIFVNGTLKAIGSSDSPIVFTSDESSGSSGQWRGIRVNEGGFAELDYVTLEYGDYGLYAASGSSFSLNNSTLRYFEEDGVYAYKASGSISNNTIQHAENAGIYLYGVADATVSENEITDNKYGFYIRGYSDIATAPTITGNTVTSNSSYGFYIQGHSSGVTNPKITGNTIIGNSSYGFYLSGVSDSGYDPQPVITGNSIYSNSSYDLYTSSYESGVLTINATGNWWNTTDSGLIAEEVYDYNDSTSYRPLVDYSGYLDEEGGSVAISNGLFGYLTEDTTLFAGTTYTLLSKLYVQSGVTLTIEPGARIEVGGYFSLKVYGMLDARGTSDSPIVFTSDESTSTAGDWYGVVAQTGGTVNLDYVELEYADRGLYGASGSNFSLTNSTLCYFERNGVYAYNASGLINNNTIKYADDAGVYLYRMADITISDNTITDNNHGFYIKGHSSGVTTPTITGNTITDNSSYGFYLYGSGNVSYDPLPVINGNSIYNNSADNVYTSNYGAGSTTNIDATGNWWNATDPGSISPTIYDYTDTGSDSNPFIDYSGFLDTEDGAAVVSHSLVGTLTEDTTLLSGNTYTMLGHLYVGTGTVLTVEPGARIESGGSYRIVVDGTLKAIGTSESPIVFTSDEESASSGQWKGIRVDEDGSVELDYVTLEYGEYGLYAQSGSSFSLSNSTVQYVEEDGVYAHNASGSISNNTIQYAENAGVYLYGIADVTVSDNAIINNKYGFYIKGDSGAATTPTITGNTITGNSSYGLYLYGVRDTDYDPQPVITGNNIYSNTSYDLNAYYYESGVLTLNATGNWWNTIDSGSIAEEVYDYNDSTSYRPIVDYSGFLDAEGGSAVIDNGLIGYLTEDTTLLANTTYTLVSSLHVKSGVTLTIEPGARIEVGGRFFLRVYGTLDAQGTSDNPIVFTSDESEPSVEDWYGIVVQSGGTVNLDYVTVEYGDSGVYAVSGSTFSINNSTLQYFEFNGVYAYNASGSISNSTIQYAENAGVYLYRVADISVSDNTITDNKYGLIIKGHSSGVTTPTITGNTITGNSSDGVYLEGVKDADYDPQPVINGNSIYSNGTYNVYTKNYGSGATTNVDATGNWWNTIDSESIATEIYDYNDSASYRPVVDYSGYLDAEGGSVVISNGLLGYVTEDTTLLADTAYTLLGKLYVQSGVTLTIEPGVLIEVGGDFSLEVYGTLDAQGTSDSPIVFTTDESTPSVGDWYGIVVQSGGTVNLDYVTLEYGNYGLYAESGSTFSLSNSTLRYFEEDGVYAYKASGSISNNTIEYAGRAGVYLYGVADVTASDNMITDNYYGFYIWGSSGVATTPTITGNTVMDNNYHGFYIRGSSGGTTTPVITGNTITGNNSYGLYLYGIKGADHDPQPMITGNSIHNNGSYDLYTSYYEYRSSDVLTINATGNWWSTTDWRSIAAEIYDYTDSTFNRPLVDYSGYLNSANGNSIYDHYLRFDIDTDTSLAAGSYIVVDDININSGVSLTLEAGAVLVFPAGHSLTVEGDLVVSGSSSQPVLFTSEAQYPAAGDWQGIVIASGGSVSMDNAYIQYAETAVSATSPSAFSVTNSIITDFSESGISINNFVGGTIANNLIQNTDYTGTGIALDTASPAVTDNIVTGLNYGAYITGASSPSLTGNSFINNNYGIYLNGSGSDVTNPTPTIIGNDLYGNTSGSLYLNNYGSSSASVLNVTGNWWGSASPEWGVDIIGVDTPEMAVDYSNALAAESRVITSNLNGNYEYFSPNNDGNQDTLTITATLSSSSSWSLEISNESGTVVNTFSGTGTDISIDWDGTDSSSTVLGDGRYYLYLNVTDAENASYRVGAIWAEMDNTAPLAEMSNVNDGVILSTGTTTLEIEGSATDHLFVSYTVDYQLSGDTDNWINLISSTSAVSENTLAEWAINSTDGTVEAPANGDYQIRLAVNDRAGNTTIIIRTVTLDLISIANVSRNQTTVNPVAGESLVVSFDLSLGATVTLDIKDEQTEALVRSVVETFENGGSYSLSWDGRDNEGNFVQEEAYTYYLTAVNGSVEGVYTIEDGGSTSDDILVGSMDTVMNAVQNDFMKTEVTPTANVRVYMEVTPGGGDTHVVYDNIPMEAGTHYMVWDGRTADGVLTTGSFYTYVPDPEILPTNAVIIDGVNPSITGTLDAPNIEVKSDPYLMYHSYDQISKVAYLLDQDSYVTFKLLPPDIGDPTNAGAITLIDNQLQAANDSDGAVATHEVEWTGYEESDGNAIMVSDEGVYSFWIEATSATTGASTTYYGALQLYQ